MALRIVEQAGRTDVGRQRSANEDSLVLCARRSSRSRTAWAARRPARWPRRWPPRPFEGAHRVRRAGRGAARAHRPRGQPAHLRPRGGRRVAPRDGHDADRGQGARRRGQPRPRRRQPRLPAARRRARAAHARPLAGRRARAQRADHAGGGRAPSAALDHHARARARSRTSRWTPTRSPAATATCS